MITTQWLTGFRISEVLSLRVGSVLRNGELVPRIGIPPRQLKGGYGGTRWVPMLSELRRALVPLLRSLEKRFGLRSDLPLFVSRIKNRDGSPKAISRYLADDILHRVCNDAGILDDGRLGTHSLRKTFAKNVYRNSGRDIMVLKAALHHANLATTEKYLEVNQADVEAAIARCDFTRGPRSGRVIQFKMVRTSKRSGKAA